MINTLTDTLYSPNLDESVRAGLGKVSDPDKAGRQVEQVFLGELLKNMLENTEFGKDKMVSSYMPYITSEIAKSLSDRGIGIHDFLMRSASFRDMVSEKKNTEGNLTQAAHPGKNDGKLKLDSERISSSYGAGAKMR